MYDVWARVRQKVDEQKTKNENVDYDLVFEDVSNELKKAGYRIGIGRVKKYYGLVQKDIRQGRLRDPNAKEKCTQG